MRIAVIGAGLLGVCTAYFLRRNGAHVLVLERQRGPGLETSFANGGMVTPSQATPWNEPGIAGRLLRLAAGGDPPLIVRPAALPAVLGWGLRFLRNSRPERYRAHVELNARLAQYSLGVLRAMRTELGLEYDQTSRGTMKVFRDVPAFERACAWSEVMAACGVSWQALDGAGAVATEPALAPIEAQIAGAILYPDDEAGDAHRFCAGVAAAAAAAGVDLRYGIDVHGLRLSGGRVDGVLTAAGPVAADACVLAAGSESPALVRRLGIDLPVRPVKGYSVTLPLDGWQRPPRRPVVDETLHVAAAPLGRRLRAVGFAEFAGYDRTLEPRRVDKLLALLGRLFPDLAPRLDRDTAMPWCGLRPMSCDGVPILGPAPLDGLYLCTGHGHLGWSMCAGSGKALADLITGAGPEIDLAPYGLARFHLRPV